MKAKRGRNFATIIYPESAPSNFKDIINSWHIDAYLSPLHDKDCDDDGEIKKAHYHLLFRFEGCKSESQVKEYIDSICGVGVEFVSSFRLYGRYLCHLDEDENEKYHYKPSDVWTTSSTPYDDLIKTSSDALDVLFDIMDFIDAYDYYIYADLLRYCRFNNPAWFKLLCSGYTLVITSYLKSREYGAAHKDLLRYNG